MLFHDSPEHAAFRAELRQFLAAELPEADWNMRNDRDHVTAEGAAFTQAFRKKLAQRGWLTMGWPKDFGGAGASYMTQTVYMEEMSAAGAPGAYDQGVVVAALTVTAQGRAADTRIIESTPPGLLDRQLLRALDGAAFRPAMADGEPVDRPDVRFRHEFRYSRATASRTGPPATESTPAAGGKGGPIAYPEAGHPAAGNHANP